MARAAGPISGPAARRSRSALLPVVVRLARVRAVHGLPARAPVAAPVLVVLRQRLRTGALAAFARAAPGLLAGEPRRVTLGAGAPLLGVVHPLGRLAPRPGRAALAPRWRVGVLARWGV